MDKLVVIFSVLDVIIKISNSDYVDVDLEEKGEELMSEKKEKLFTILKQINDGEKKTRSATSS